VHQGACINYPRDPKAVFDAERLVPLLCGVGLAIVKSVRMKGTVSMYTARRIMMPLHWASSAMLAGEVVLRRNM
jgi:hypothetical protein